MKSRLRRIVPMFWFSGLVVMTIGWLQQRHAKLAAVDKKVALRNQGKIVFIKYPVMIACVFVLPLAG
jgi:peptidoglycan/LPS O-acetylase OafA/YrhL